MSTSKTFFKNFNQFQGIDRDSSDLTRDPKFASDCENADLSSAGALVKRKGFHAVHGNSGGCGLGTYLETNTTTGSVTETLIAVDNTLRIQKSDSISVTYSGSNISLLSIYFNTTENEYYCKIVELSNSGQTTILDTPLGIGYDENVPVTIANLKTTIDNLADYACTGGTNTTVSAAYIIPQTDTVLSSSAVSLSYSYWDTPLASISSTPLSTTFAARNNTDFENCTFANINNVLYISSGYDGLYKYDSRNFYKAGLPAPTTAIANFAETGSGTAVNTGEEYFFFYTYEYKDAKGNIIESQPSPYSSKYTVVAANTDLTFTVPNLTTSGYNLRYARINGTQSGPISTITVDSGHTILAGDVVLIRRNATDNNKYERTVTSVTATTITINSPINSAVSDNLLISASMAINIYVTDDNAAKSGTAEQYTYRLLVTIPNDPSSSTQTYQLSSYDSPISYSFEWVPPIKNHGPPPIGRYIYSHVGQLILAGDPQNTNTVYYSDIESPEYFPTDQNSFDVSSFLGARVTGISSLGPNLVVFKDKSVQSIVGYLNDDTFRVDDVSFGELGTIAHHSIQKVGNQLLFLSSQGICAFNGSQSAQVGQRVDDLIKAYNLSFNFKKATSAIWTDNDKYLLFVPSESQDSSNNFYADSDSKMLAYDYSSDAWFPWTQVNAIGGISFANNKLYFTARRLDSDSTVVEMVTYQIMENGSAIDYADHNLSIPFVWKTNWEAGGEPNIFKKFSRLKTFAIPSDALDSELPSFSWSITQEFNYITPSTLPPFTINYDGNSDGYGLGSWGEEPWGDSTLAEIKSKLKSVKCRSMRLIFENNNILENVIMSGYELEVMPSYYPHMKE